MAFISYVDIFVCCITCLAKCFLWYSFPNVGQDSVWQDFRFISKICCYTTVVRSTIYHLCSSNLETTVRLLITCAAVIWRLKIMQSIYARQGFKN